MTVVDYQSEYHSVLKAIEECSSTYQLDAAEITRMVNELEAAGKEVNQQALFYSLNKIAMDQPDWTFVAARIYLTDLYKQASKNRAYDSSRTYGDFYELIVTLTEKGIYSPKLLQMYTEEEIREIAKAISPERDELFNYIGLFLFADRYLARDHDRNVYELPQERFLVIAMTIMMNEAKEKRAELVKEAYWALSHLYMTVATPTLSNAGKSFGQLSSCFIDTVDDSLDGIYLNNWDIARLSKEGGGIGIYYGKVRALGSDIKRFKGMSSGVVP
jgi:ribonucleoside-diphosphate reductase alpha chain